MPDTLPCGAELQQAPRKSLFRNDMTATDPFRPRGIGIAAGKPRNPCKRIEGLPYGPTLPFLGGIQHKAKVEVESFVLETLFQVLVDLVIPVIAFLELFF